MGEDEDVGSGGAGSMWSPLRVAAKDKELELEEVEDVSVEEMEVLSSSMNEGKEEVKTVAFALRKPRAMI